MQDMADKSSCLEGVDLLRSRFTLQEGSERRVALGYTCPQTEGFVWNCEFISLGCYCTIAQALAHLIVRHRTYPFDWVRSPMDGVIHCLETNFEDFLTYTNTFEKIGHEVFAGSRWGGSFWHHNLRDDSVKLDFSRRIERLIGFEEVPACKPRLFVRLLNSTREVDLALKLKHVLDHMFPDAPIFLLLIVDMQEVTGPMCLDGVDGLLVYFLDIKTVYDNMNSSSDVDYQARSKAYAQVIAFAARFWAGGASELAAACVFQSLTQLAASCKQWYGGDPAHDLFSPQYFQGHTVSLSTKAASKLPELFHGRHAEFKLPEGVVAGGLIKFNVFGQDVSMRLPEGAAAGHLVKCRLVEGVLSTVMVLLTSSVAATAAATAATLAAERHDIECRGAFDA